jgi:hypothetical protein
MSRFTSRLASATMITTVAFTGVASATPGHRPYAKTFPHASHLCKVVAAGHAPKKLKGQEAKVLQSCSTLQSSYDSAAGTALNAQATFKSQRATALAQAKATCQAPATTKPMCLAAKKSARQTIKSDRMTLTSAYKTYHSSIEAARKAFWGSIKTLRGGSSVTPDAPDANAPVPGASTVPAT